MVVQDIYEKLIAIQQDFVKKHPYQPNELDFQEWISTMPHPKQDHYLMIGFERLKHSLSFKTFCIEKHNEALSRHMSSQLNEEEYLLWEHLSSDC